MIIIETCPKCGHDLHDIMLASFPPIPRKECLVCGWSCEGEREQIIRAPFSGNMHDVNYEDPYPYIVGRKINGEFDGTISNEQLNEIKQKLKGFFGDNMYEPFHHPACLNCHSNPKNGGDGICFCTLGQMNVVY